MQWLLILFTLCDSENDLEMQTVKLLFKENNNNYNNNNNKTKQNKTKTNSDIPCAE